MYAVYPSVGTVYDDGMRLVYVEAVGHLSVQLSFYGWVGIGELSDWVKRGHFTHV